MSDALPTATPQLRVFVYGTLKLGYKNHDRYCRGFRQVTEAFVWGRLYGLRGRFPMLLIPNIPVLAYGSLDPQTDLKMQSHWMSQDLAQHPAMSRPDGDWQQVGGQVFAFDDPATRLPRLDELEAFSPGGRGMYDRVLLPVAAAARIETCWLYVAPGGRLPEGAELLSGDWIE